MKINIQRAICRCDDLDFLSFLTTTQFVCLEISCSLLRNMTPENIILLELCKKEPYLVLKTLHLVLLLW